MRMALDVLVNESSQWDLHQRRSDFFLHRSPRAPSIREVGHVLTGI